jgi:inosine triphosphate pyrophosphatase
MSKLSDELTFITGNQHKADLLAKWLDLPVTHRKVDLDEIQSLDAYKVAEHKVRQAYQIVQAPVLVEDVSLSFTAMGRLPGTLIKWFLEEMTLQQLCAMAAALPHQRAICTIVYALYDGTTLHYFDASQDGSIPSAPRGDNGFGWNPIFMPDGSGQTYAEMDQATIDAWSVRAKAIKKLHSFLTEA